MATFVWPDCPGGAIAVPGRPARVVNGRVLPGCKRRIVRFAGTRLTTEDPEVIAAVRARMPQSRGEIREIGKKRPQAEKPVEPTLELIQAVLSELGALPVSVDPDLDGAFEAVML